ncbi:hypothetical protein BLOT_010832 [Blomia tropicalis]|nr:hypothetical protein BLOT_010832 [Blomia tropicalis]
MSLWFRCFNYNNTNNAQFEMDLILCSDWNELKQVHANIHTNSIAATIVGTFGWNLVNDWI